VDEYSYFTVGDEASKYQLNVAGHSGNGTNVLMNDTGCLSVGRHNGMKFSTYDQDNDLSSSGNCASSHGGGWWHNFCCCVCPTRRDRGHADSLGYLQASRMLIKLG
jgi:ficolin